MEVSVSLTVGMWTERQPGSEAGSGTKRLDLGQVTSPGLSLLLNKTRTWVQSLFFELYFRRGIFFFSKKTFSLILFYQLNRFFFNGVILVEIEEGLGL